MTADLVVGAGLVVAAAVVLVVACVFVGGQPAPVVPEHADMDAAVERALEDGRADAAMAAAEFPQTPVFDALVADVCAAAVANVDAEWADLADGAA